MNKLYEYKEIFYGVDRKKEFWGGTVLKIRRRLSRWKGKFMSLVGRVCLIKSVLTATQLFLLSIFKMPKEVREQIIQIQRDFLWGWGHDHR